MFARVLGRTDPAVALADLDPRGIWVAGATGASTDLFQIDSYQLAVLTPCGLLAQLAAVWSPVEPTTVSMVVTDPDNRHPDNVLPFDERGYHIQTELRHVRG